MVKGNRSLSGVAPTNRICHYYPGTNRRQYIFMHLKLYCPASPPSFKVNEDRATDADVFRYLSAHKCPGCGQVRIGDMAIYGWHDLKLQSVHLLI